MLNLIKISRGGVASDTRLDLLHYMVFDTEFTSAGRAGRLLSIGAVKMEGGRIRLGEQFYRECNPGTAAPARTVVVHRLRSEDVAGANGPQEIAREFFNFCAGAVVVGHFVQHDVAIVAKELGTSWRPESVDSARVHRWLEMRHSHYPVEAFDERTIRLDLESVSAHYGVRYEEAHHALADAFVTAQVWQRQLAALEQAGIRSWGELKKTGG